MSKKVKWGLIAVICLFIVGMIVYPSFKRKQVAEKQLAEVVPSQPRQQRVLNVNAEIVKEQELSDKIQVTATTLPDEEVDLSFESSGKIVSIEFKEGERVKKGDLLAKINDAPLQAQLRKLEAQLPLAKDRVFRQQTLLQRDAVSQEAYEQVRTDLEILNAEIDLVKANIAQTELRAPFDGTLGLRLVSEGAYASPSIVVTKLTKSSPLKIEFGVPEKYAQDIKVGVRITFRLEDSKGILKNYAASIYAVESQIEEDMRMLKVRATYPNSNEEIMPGRYAYVEVTEAEIKDALTIPSEAIIPEMGKDIVYVYRGGVAQPVELTLGLRTESRLQVLQGVEKGDTVITTAVMQLRTGVPVKIEKLN